MSKSGQDLYQEKLLHPSWQKRKGEILLRDNHTCRSCGATNITLHAHHLLYIDGNEPWDYPDELLITYCEICHNTEHFIGTVLKKDLIELIEEKPLMIHMVAQLCILTEKLPDFDKSLRSFLRSQINIYYTKRNNNAK